MVGGLVLAQFGLHGATRKEAPLGAYVVGAIELRAQTASGHGPAVVEVVINPAAIGTAIVERDEVIAAATIDHAEILSLKRGISRNFYLRP